MTKEERPVFLQPKILLIDLDPEIEFKLKHLGYSVQGGSFGQPVIIPPEFASIIRFHSIRQNRMFNSINGNINVLKSLLPLQHPEIKE